MELITAIVGVNVCICLLLISHTLSRVARAHEKMERNLDALIADQRAIAQVKAMSMEDYQAMQEQFNYGRKQQ